MKNRSILTTVVTLLVTIIIGWFICVLLYMPQHNYQCITVDGRIVNTTHIRRHYGSMICITEEGETVEIISFKEVAGRKVHGD